MKNIHTVNFLLAASLFSLRQFAGWDVPIWLIAAPLCVMALYSIMDISFSVRQIIHGHRQLSLKAKADLVEYIKADLDFDRSKRKLAAQSERGKKGKKKREADES